LTGAVFAQVESVNIVGYSTTSLENGFNMVGVNFEAVGGGAADLNNVVIPDGLAGISDWDNFTGGDQLLIWDPAAQGYPVFYTWTGPNAESVGGCEAGTNNKWVDLNTWNLDVATLPVIDIPVGGAAWVLRTTVGLASLTFSGQVKTTATQVALEQGFNMFANTMPVSLNANNASQVTFTGLAGISDWDNFTGGDQLLIWDPAAQGYPVFYTWTGPNAESVGGCEAGTNNKWVDLNTWNLDVATLPVIDIPVGGAAWLQRTTAGAASITVSAL